MKTFSTDYMADFKCLGSDCEDTCCKHWLVKVDHSHYTAIMALGEGNPEFAAHLARSLRRNEEPTEESYAHIEMREDGFCPMLNDSKMCRLQLKAGFDALPNTCTYYPRVIYQIDDRIEVIGALSCPEVARKCFTNIHRPGLVEVGEEVLPRVEGLPITHRIDTQTDAVYERLFPQIREQFLALAYHPLLTTKQKLYLLCYGSNRLREHYHVDAGDECEAQVRHELERLASNELREALVKRLDAFEDKQRLGLITIQSILLIRGQHYQTEPLTPYIRDIIDSYFGELKSDKPFEIEIETLAEVYHRRKSAILEVARSQVEGYLSKHLQNCLMREWYIRFPDPFSYMQMLAVRHALLRFLLYSHPSIYRWCLEHEEHNDATLGKVVEELSVEMFYLFSRSIEHDIPFLQHIYSALVSEGMMTLDTSLSLIKGV